MRKISRLFAAACLLAIGIGAPHAQGDPDLPSVPQPGPPLVGPPCYGTVCLHNWSNALAVFFEQKQCLKNGSVVGASPFDLSADCQKLDYLSPGEVLPYHKTDGNGNWFDDIPVLTQNGLIAVGLQCYHATCGNNPGSPEAVSNSPGDVFWSSLLTVAHAKNNDGGGPGIHVNQQCAGKTVTVLSLDDTRIFLDNTATEQGVGSGESGLYGQKYIGIRDQNCPADNGHNYNLQNDAWHFSWHQYPLGLGKVQNPPLSGSLLTLIHTDSFAMEGEQQDCHLEQEYFVREMGKVRHEAFHNDDCGDPNGYYQNLHNLLAADPGDCGDPLYALEPPPGHWTEISCAAYYRSAVPNGTADDDPQKAIDILTASNLTYVLFNQQAPTDNPRVDSISPSTIGQDSTLQLTLHGLFPINRWFGNNVKVMFGASGGINTISTLGFGSNGNTTIVFKISADDWANLGLQCGNAVDVRIFDGVSTSNSVPLSITC